MQTVEKVKKIFLSELHYLSERVESISFGDCVSGSKAIGIVLKGSTLIKWFVISKKDFESFNEHFNAVVAFNHSFDFPETFITSHYQVEYLYTESIGNRASYLGYINSIKGVSA